MKVNVRNRFAVGDWLEIIHPAGNTDVLLTAMENVDALPMTVAPGSGHTVWLALPESAVGAFVARYVNAADKPGGPHPSAVLETPAEAAKSASPSFFAGGKAEGFLAP